MSITAIIVTHNSAHVIEKSLQSILDNIHIIACMVVDNASTDSTVAVIRQTFPGVTLIQNDRNVGFGGACNQALEKVCSEFSLLLNPDACIDAHAVQQLLGGLAAHPNAAIIAPSLVGSNIPNPSTMALPVAFISGAVALWRMQHMKKVGFFDPAFFLFYEDNDISLRTRKAGYDILFMPEVKAHHIPGTSCSPTAKLESLKLRSTTWSYLYFQHKHHGRVIAIIIALIIILRSAGGIGYARAFTAVKRRKKKLEGARKKHEESWVEATDRHEKQWRMTIERLKSIPLSEIERQAWLKAAAADHEKKWLATTRQLECIWTVAIMRQDKRLLAMRKRKENRNKLWAARHFLSHPERFIISG